ncbi:type I secretion system permease/ATPase [Sphingomonas sp.]|uniref:type I secretion system permease/ATPase n=1 Tax=Sphingomonas sp. TaxID=28214 RepID=UPI00286DB3B8|nr:type I secretion system permease/ATPase [Sphingomonas sp.]
MRIAGIQLPAVVADAVRDCRPHFIAAMLFSFLVNLLFLAPALYMLQVYDRVVATGGKTTLLFVTLALAVALMTLAALDGIRNRLLVRASVRLDTLLAPQILKRMMANGSNASIQAMRDFDTVRQTIASPVSAAVLDAPWSPLFLVVAFMLHFWIGVLAVVSAVLLLAVAWRNQRATQETTQVATRAMAASHASEQAVALHSQTVRALGMQGAMVSRQLQQRAVGLTSLAQAQFAGGRYSALSRFLRLFVQSAALGLGALLAIAGYISAGAIIAASILISRALQPIEGLIGGWSSLNSARAALERLTDALGRDEPERIRTALPAPKGRIDVEQVGVRSPDGRAVLFGVSFQAKPGEIFGIIGPSGSGKTTLAKVIAGAVVPDVGTVRIDGAQLSDWEQDELARHIGYVPQEPGLIEGTIKENISRFAAFAGGGMAGGEDIDAKVVHAAQRAGVHELILQFPQGYDTRLGPLGAGLSAGQAQRIAIARAFYGDPKVLIFDEPNAFLDGDGETALIHSIDQARKAGATVLVIAHRRAVLHSADRLLVLAEGKPKLLGPAKEVVARLSGTPGTPDTPGAAGAERTA